MAVRAVLTTDRRVPLPVTALFQIPLSLQSLSVFSVRPTPVLPQWHVKDPGYSAKSAGGRLHLTMHTPLTLVRKSD